MKRKVIVIAAAVVGVIVLCVLGSEAFLKHYVKREIEKALAGTGAAVEMGRVAVSLPRRLVAVHDVRIVAQNNDAYHRGFTVVSLDVSLGSVTVRGIGFKKEEGLPALSADRLAVESPRATLVTKKVGEKAPETDTPPPSKDLRRTISEKFASLDIGKVSVSDVALEYVQWLSDSESTRLTLTGADLSALKINLDSLPSEVRLTADSVVYGFGAGSKVLRADSIVLNASAGTLALGGFALVPQFPKHEFARRAKSHEDWTSVALDGIFCRGIDFEGLLTRRELVIDSVSLDRAEVASYKNRQVFQQPRTKPMLYQSIQQIPLPFDVKTLTFHDLDVTYEELAENGNLPGKVTLTHGRGKAANITNIPTGHERFMTIDCTAAFMDGGTLDARFLFPVDVADDHWEASGTLGATDMAAFNGALEPLMNARITAGRIKNIDFRITGTLTQSHSRLTMTYNDLQVAMLDKDDPTRTRRFLTFLADDVLIRSDNPERDGRGKLREGAGGHTRDPERSMWNYIWHSLLPAILKTVV